MKTFFWCRENGRCEQSEAAISEGREKCIEGNREE
jgi:hypothetical protein